MPGSKTKVHKVPRISGRGVASAPGAPWHASDKAVVKQHKEKASRKANPLKRPHG